MFSDGAIRRLEDETVIWMTTVSEGGQPQTALIWFLWTGSDFLLYSIDPSIRVRNISGNPRVALNLDGNGQGGDVVTVEGTAVFAAASEAEREAFVERYRDEMQTLFGGPDGYFEGYPTPIRVAPTKVREYLG